MIHILPICSLSPSLQVVRVVSPLSLIRAGFCYESETAFFLFSLTDDRELVSPLSPLSLFNMRFFIKFIMAVFVVVSLYLLFFFSLSNCCESESERSEEK